VRSVPGAVALLMVGLTISSIGALFFNSGSPSKTLFLKNGSPSKMAQGEVRCEGAGAIVININGADYAVNGMASRRYPPIQRVWNSATHPESDIDRIIVRGLTLCDWGSKNHSTLNASAIN
jgi:hypothetical protein